MKKISLFIIAIFASAGCTKIDVNMASIAGEWVETYEDYPHYAEEGFVSWNFNTDGSVDIRFYDVFAGNHSTTTKYQISLNEKDGASIITFPSSEYTMDIQAFVVTKLTKIEMEWQRLGTTFQEGTVGSDFKHFVRK
ncbi:MAG: hypothetical protein MJZ09_01290 [Bacteroidales bacterium]|nr:hypothetical protein [Bacteroidales bacterium]